MKQQKRCVSKQMLKISFTVSACLISLFCLLVTGQEQILTKLKSSWPIFLTGGLWTVILSLELTYLDVYLTKPYLMRRLHS